MAFLFHFFLAGEEANFLLMLLRTIVALAVVCGIVYLLFRWLLPRLQHLQPPGKMMRVVDSLAVGERQRVMIVEVANRYFLVSAAGGGGVQLIGELDAKEIAESEEKLRATNAAARAPFGTHPTLAAFGSKFSRVLKKPTDSREKQ